MTQLPDAIDERLRRGGMAARLATAYGPVVAGRLEVDLDGTRVKLPAARTGVAYAAGDGVLVLTDGPSSWVVANLAAGVVPPVVVAPPAVTYVDRNASATPASTGTYRGGWLSFTDALYQGDYGGQGVHEGAAYYGDQLVGLGHVAGQPATIDVTIRRTRGGNFSATAPTLTLLAERNRPAGSPTRQATVAGPALAVGDGAVFRLPDAWTTALLAGTAGGIGCYVAGANPYVVLAGRSAAADGFALAVAYRTR